MGQKLSSLLLALSIYATVVFAAVYSYVHYRSSLLSATQRQPKSIALTLAGSKHTQESASLNAHKSPSYQKKRKKEKDTIAAPEKQHEQRNIPQQAKMPPPKKADPAPPAKIRQQPVALSTPAAPNPLPDPEQTKGLHPKIPPLPAATLPQPAPAIPTVSHVAVVQKKWQHKQPTSSLAKKQKRSLKKLEKKRRITHSKQGMRGSNLKRSGSAGKNRFLARLKARINRNKQYPRIAKRRGIKGVLRVSFTILKSGRVGAIRISGPSLFHRATREAVQRAFPLNPASVPFSLPRKIRFTMRYQ